MALPEKIANLIKSKKANDRLEAARLISQNPSPEGVDAIRLAMVSERDPLVKVFFDACLPKDDKTDATT